ncbi:MAG TPA: hypothetical protein VM053_07665 [Gemmatimonadaceae bacterium]|nr:hypothetical protein [Gemmatimonadaceae bacterium]
MPPDHTYSSKAGSRARSASRTLSVCAAAAFLVASAACREVGPAFGPTIPAARANAEGLFGGIAQRFTNVQRNPKFSVARGKLGKNALTPSAIYNDTSVWTAMGTDGSRTVTVEGGFLNSRYLFAARPGANAPDQAGDSRHLMVLRRLTDDEFEWLTNVDISAGTITADDMHNVISALMKSAEHRTPAAVRSDYRASFPRTTAALGRLLSLDTLRLAYDADSATTITLGIKLNPDKLSPTMPAFAAYLDKYATESRYRSVVTDKRGGRWLELWGAKNVLNLKLRSLNGHFVPLNGPPRPIPRDLQMESSFTTKILLFHVGFSKMISNVTLIEGDHERGWFLRFTKEPDWQLPPTIGFFIRTPLRRPFQGQGSIFRLAILDAPGRQSIIGRRTTAVVQESAILRFLNRLSGTAMGDFVGKAEVEENRFSAEAFNAMRLDARALLQ